MRNNCCCCKCCYECHDGRTTYQNPTEVTIELSHGCSVGGGNYEYHVNGVAKMVPYRLVRQYYQDYSAVGVMQKLGEELSPLEIKSIKIDKGDYC